MRVLALAAALVLPAILSGCLAQGAILPGAGAAPMSTSSVSNGTWPDGDSARGYIRDYVMTHPFRFTGAPFQSFMDEARDDLETELTSFGLWVDEHAWSNGGESGINVLAIQNGTVDPDEWIVLSAHYDTVVGTGATVYGAWDDGAGVATLLELARTLSSWDFPFTVVYAFFDGEEKGLLGSAAFVDDYYGSSVDLVANLNTDPPGLNWPCGDVTGAFPVKVIHEMAKVNAGTYGRYEWLYDAVEYGLGETAVPTAHRDYTDGIPIAAVLGAGLAGTSDHASFAPVDVANVFLGGTPVTGVAALGTAAMTYPLHTPLDTLDAMDARCATGAGDLADGLQTILDVYAHALWWMGDQGTPAP